MCVTYNVCVAPYLDSVGLAELLGFLLLGDRPRMSFRITFAASISVVPMMLLIYSSSLMSLAWLSSAFLFRSSLLLVSSLFGFSVIVSDISLTGIIALGGLYAGRGAREAFVVAFCHA